MPGSDKNKMSGSTIYSHDLHEAAEQFKLASKDTLEISKRLDNTISQLDKKWEGASKQVFYKQYQQWSQAEEGFMIFLNSIAQELNAMADRYEQIDQKF
jgi:WXG100 family type VII secretion target